MAKFQISYDVKDSKKTDNKAALEGLVESVVKKLGATAVERPVASTLTFEANITRSRAWDVLSTWAKTWGIWYLASEIVDSEDGKHWRCITVPDGTLQEEIDAMVQEVKGKK